MDAVTKTKRPRIFYGGGVPLSLSIQGDYFEVRAFATISAVIGAVTTIGSAPSPVFAGWIYDSSQSYRPAWSILSIFGLAAIPFILLVRPPQPRREAQR